MIRERDQWGLSEALRAQGVAPQRWHVTTEESLLELDNRRRNGRWETLWPHLRPSEN